MRNPREASLLRRIDETSFAMDDAALYLDTHPWDKNALNYYRQVIAMRKEAMKAYEDQFGPLMLDQVQCGDCWTWGTECWPWDGEV